MKGITMNGASATLMPLALGLICAGVVYTTLAGKSLPLISGPRSALIALLILGMAACTSGIGQTAASGRWLAPIAIAGYLMGVAILVIIGSALVGVRLPWIQNEMQAVTAVAILMAVKLFIGVFASFFHWL